MIPIGGELWIYFNTCCVLIPNFDGAVMGGRRHLSGATRRRREEHAGCRGLNVAPVLHHFAAGLTQIPELTENRRTDTSTLKSQEPCMSEEHACTAELVREFYRTQRVQKLEGNESVVIGGQRWVSDTEGKNLLFKIVNVDTQYWKEQLKMQLNVDLYFFWRDLQNKIQF